MPASVCPFLPLTIVDIYISGKKTKNLKSQHRETVIRERTSIAQLLKPTQVPISKAITGS